MAKAEALIYQPGAYEWSLRRLDVADGAYFDHSNDHAWPVRLLKLHKLRYRGGLLPFRIHERTIPVLQEDDCEPYDLSRPPNFHSATGRMTKDVRRQESNETAHYVINVGGENKGRAHPLAPIVIAAEIVAIGAIAMVGWSFVQNNGIFG